MIQSTLDAVSAGIHKNEFDVLCIGNIYKINNESSHFQIPITLTRDNRSVKTTALLDSGATTNFINKKFVQEHHIRTHNLPSPRPLFNVDGTLNKAGTVNSYASLKLTIREHTEQIPFTVTNIGSDNTIIGLTWLRQHNPNINWKDGHITLSQHPTSTQKEEIKST